MTQTIRHQAAIMGHQVVGKLTRVKDDVFYKHNPKTGLDEEVRFKQYVDSEGTLYAVSPRGSVAYIAGDDWVL